MSGRVNGKQTNDYTKLFEAVELTSTRTKSLNYESFEKNPSINQCGSVDVQGGFVKLHEENKRLDCSVGFDVVIKTETDQVSFEMKLLYLLLYIKIYQGS